MKIATDFIIIDKLRDTYTVIPDQEDNGKESIGVDLKPIIEALTELNTMEFWA